MAFPSNDENYFTQNVKDISKPINSDNTSATKQIKQEYSPKRESSPKFVTVDLTVNFSNLATKELKPLEEIDNIMNASKMSSGSSYNTIGAMASAVSKVDVLN